MGATKVSRRYYWTVNTSQRVDKTRRNGLNSRALRVESLEAREMLDVDPFGFVDSASGAATNVASFSNAVPDKNPTTHLVEPATGASLSDGDTLQFKSYYIDSSGYALDPAYGETVYARVIIRNVGDDLLEIASPTLSEGSRVEFVGGFKSTLPPNEKNHITLKWRAVEAEAATLTIVSNDPDQPTFELDLSGSIRANTTILPTLGALWKGKIAKDANYAIANEVAE